MSETNPRSSSVERDAEGVEAEIEVAAVREASAREGVAAAGARAAADHDADEVDAPAPTLLRALWGDLRRGAALAALGCAAVAVVELPITWWVYPQDLSGATLLRLVALDLTLFALAWLVFAGLLGGAAIVARLGYAARSADAARAWRGLLAARVSPARGPGRAAPWLWALGIGALLYLCASSFVTWQFIHRFKEKQLMSLLLSVVQLGAFAVVAGITYLLATLLGRAGRALDRPLGGWNPFGRVAPALGMIAALGAVAVVVLLRVMPQMKPLVPWRHILALAVFTAGAWAAAQVIARRGRLLPRDRKRRMITVGGILFAVTLLVPVTLLRVGADPETKFVAITSSPPMTTMIDLVRSANDFDGDGFGSLLGENDCAPFDETIHPGARDIPDNGVDENCDGRDFSFGSIPSYRTGERMPVPEAFQQDWNFLLLTIDTVRYDHTGFGGYIEERGRDTTPNLDDLVAESVSFTFANAPSAGTMASVPAILCSKFFHSGIALDEDVPHPMPPRLKPENLLISEVLKRGGYYTGAILTHEYFNDWGMEQGFDTYDNSIGEEPDPYRVSSQDVTDRALAWISRNARRDKWFLWAHYIDPHGRYVAHPGEKSFGESEEDLYDGELWYTDKHIGRLLDGLRRMPGADRTVIIITSDHGDAFNEHGFINHGQALYRELLHVPLVFYIPNLPPKTVDGAVSPLDILPTVADLAGIDVSDTTFEGESLVPQLFYDRDAHNRVVFAETNWPRPLRAAVTSEYKLVHNLQNNIYELYDLDEDPWEKRNIATRDKEGRAKMKRYLDDWLERVYFSRDPVMNQAAMHLRDTLLRGKPNPHHDLPGISFDDGRIEVIGYDLTKRSFTPGEKLGIAVYMKVNAKPSDSFRLQIECWPVDGEATHRPASRSRLRLTRNGLFPSDRWRQGEYIRDRFGCTLPKAWKGTTRVGIGLRMTARDGTKLEPAGGETRPDNPNVVKLGEAELVE